ncbi:hypothetical protein Tco_1024950 [Tanacetum coccineum]
MTRAGKKQGPTSQDPSRRAPQANSPNGPQWSERAMKFQTVEGWQSARFACLSNLHECNHDINQSYFSKARRILTDDGCERRGFSFIHTLLGIALNELHLYGDPAVVPLIQRLLSVNGNNVQHLQQLLYNGKEMRSAEAFSGFGLTNGDLLMMISSSRFLLMK